MCMRVRTKRACAHEVRTHACTQLVNQSIRSTALIQEILYPEYHWKRKCWYFPTVCPLLDFLLKENLEWTKMLQHIFSNCSLFFKNLTNKTYLETFPYHYCVKNAHFYYGKERLFYYYYHLCIWISLSFSCLFLLITQSHEFISKYIR